MLSYKPHIVQDLEHYDYEALVQLANEYLLTIQTDECFLVHINYTDEFVFHVNENVNKHKVRNWGLEIIMSKEKNIGIQKN